MTKTHPPKTPIAWRRKASVAAVALVLVACLNVYGTAPFGVAVVRAQSDGPAQPEGRRIKTLSRTGGPIYSNAHEAYEEGKHDDALKHLNKLISGGSAYSDYDIARAHEMRAFIYSDRRDYSAALKDLKTAITPADRVNAEEALRIRYALAQLYLATEQYAKAIPEFERWFADQNDPPAQAYMQFAQAYVLVGQASKALPYAEKGYAMLTEPNENWYRLMATIYIQTQNYRSAIPVLEKIIAYWPTDKNYFNQLAYCYSTVNRDEDAFAVQALAYHNGLLTEHDDIFRVAQLYRANGYPYKSATILSAEMDAGRVNKTKKTWEELGFAWAQAREHKRAIPPLTNAAQASSDGKLFFQLCQTYFFDENWDKANDTCRQAISKGGLTRDNQVAAWMLIGNAAYKTSDRPQAIEAFSSCAQVTNQTTDDTADIFAETQDGCRTWIDFIEREQALEQRAALRKQEEAEALSQRHKEQEEQVRKVLQQQDLFSDDTPAAP